MVHDCYLVGSVPMENAEAVFSAVGGALGSAIKQIPDGETGDRLDWAPDTWRRHGNMYPISPSARNAASGAGRPETIPELLRIHAEAAKLD